MPADTRASPITGSSRWTEGERSIDSALAANVALATLLKAGRCRLVKQSAYLLQVPALISNPGAVEREGSEDLLESLSDSLSNSLGDLAGALRRANRHIFAGPRGALTNRFGGTYRMQRDEVAGSFGGALGRAAGSLRCTLADVPRAAADILAGAGLGQRGHRENGRK